MKYPAASN